MTDPVVSVVIPTYNRANYLLEAIESVRTQTYKDYEIIVIDDGSEDNTRESLQKQFESGTIRYIYQENRGESAARNHGIRLARGRYIAFLDSDDLFMPMKLEKQTSFLDNHPEIGFVHSWHSKFDDAGNHLGIRDTSVFSGWVYPEILLNWSVLIPPTCVMVRTDVLSEIGGFDEDQSLGPDLDMWRRITRRYPIGLIPEVLSKVRVHPGNISGRRVDAVLWFERYLQKAFDDDPGLDTAFRRRAWANLYTNTGHNMLGEQSPYHMAEIRNYSLKAITRWPFTLGAYFGIIISFLPAEIRIFFLKKWRAKRNPPR
jgi:glycosyltransferase involved in cell wall biosynthesis